MWRPHVCYVCKRSVCGGDEPQPVAHLSHKLQCARQSLKIMVSYGNKYPRHNARPHVVEQSGQCARALKLQSFPKSNKENMQCHSPITLKYCLAVAQCGRCVAQCGRCVAQCGRCVAQRERCVAQCGRCVAQCGRCVAQCGRCVAQCGRCGRYLVRDTSAGDGCGV